MSNPIQRLTNLNGIFSVLKPEGITSAKAVQIIKDSILKSLHLPLVSSKKIQKLLKVGHGGTLDPMATGVLIIGVGRGCKELTQQLKNTTKQYRATLRLGIEHDTLDRTGLLLWASPMPAPTPTKEEFELLLKQKFTGLQSQRPPSFSAIHVGGGKRAHEVAREHQKALLTSPTAPTPPELIIKEREINIYDIRVWGPYESPNTMGIEMECSSGTYVRSLIRDIGIALNTKASMYSLERSVQGKYNLDNSISIEDCKVDIIEKLL